MTGNVPNWSAYNGTGLTTPGTCGTTTYTTRPASLATITCTGSRRFDG